MNNPESLSKILTEVAVITQQLVKHLQNVVVVEGLKSAP